MVGGIGESVMPEQAAQQDRGAIQGGSRPSAGPNTDSSRGSSKSPLIGVGVAGALLTAAAIAGVVMMSGSGSAPINTQVATVSAPQLPAMSPAAVAPQSSASDQCQVGRPQQLALKLFASKPTEVGNTVRFTVGSYVSPPFVLTSSPQVVTFPAPPGSNGSAQMMTEQQSARGFTLSGVDGLDGKFGPVSDDHLRAIVNLHWPAPRC
jgi:hypothetical protein